MKRPGERLPPESTEVTIKRMEHKRIYQRLYHRHKARIKIRDMTKRDYDKLLIEQKYRCALCRNLPKEGKVLSIDHDHVTNVVRGLLCTSCNLGMSFVDKINWLDVAITYRRLHRGKGKTTGS